MLLSFWPLSAHGSAQIIHRSQSNKRCQDLHETCCTLEDPLHEANTLTKTYRILKAISDSQTYLDWHLWAQAELNILDEIELLSSSYLMIVRVVMSRATLVPGLSLVLSSWNNNTRSGKTNDLAVTKIWIIKYNQYAHLSATSNHITWAISCFDNNYKRRRTLGTEQH